MPVAGLHGPSPVAFLPSLPPLHVWWTFGSMNEEPSEKACEKASWLLTDEQDSPCPISCCMSTPPSSAAHGTWFCCCALLYSAWKLNGVPEQSAMLVFWKPFAALATMKPVWPVVKSRTTALSPPVSGDPESRTSLIDTPRLSPEFIFSVWPFPKKVPTLGSCGAGGPGGTPLVCRNEKLTGSMQLLLEVAKLKLHSRLSMFSAAHHLVLLQLVESANGANPGG